MLQTRRWLHTAISCCDSLQGPSSTMNYARQKTTVNSVEIQNHNFPGNSINIRLHQNIGPSTLLNCPSDLIALRSFLLCDQQPNWSHNARDFYHIVNVVTRLKTQFKTVNELIRGLESVGCVPSAQTLLLMLRIYWRGKMHCLVLEAFEAMVTHGYTPNTVARNIIMDVYFKVGHPHMALIIFKETKARNVSTFIIAICNLCNLKDFSSIREILRIMLREGYHPYSWIFKKVLNCFCKMNRMVESFQVLSLMITFGIPPSVKVWNILIDGYCRSNRLDMATCLFKKMDKLGFSPDVVTFTTLVRAYVKSKMFNSAINMLSIMESEGCAPDLVLCNTLMDCLSAIGRFDTALEVFFGLQKQNLGPDSYTFSIIIKTLCLSKRFALLPELVSRQFVPSDLFACNSLLNYFCKAGLPQVAVEFYNDMIDRGFEPNSCSYAGVLKGLCKVGRIDEAINVYHGILMTHSDIDAPRIHTIIVDELMKAGQLNRAIREFKKAVEKYPLDNIAYDVAICGLFRGGRIDEACILYGEMKVLGLSPTKHTCSTMLLALCKERDIKVVEEILQEMINARIELDFNVFEKINSLLFNLQHSGLAYNLLIEMWISGLMLDRAICALLLNGLAYGVDISDTHLSLLNDCLEGRLIPDISGCDEVFHGAALMG